MGHPKGPAPHSCSFCPSLVLVASETLHPSAQQMWRSFVLHIKLAIFIRHPSREVQKVVRFAYIPGDQRRGPGCQDALLGVVSLCMRPDEITYDKYREEAWELSPGALHI